MHFDMNLNKSVSLLNKGDIIKLDHNSTTYITIAPQGTYVYKHQLSLDMLEFAALKVSVEVCTRQRIAIYITIQKIKVGSL